MSWSFIWTFDDGWLDPPDSLCAYLHTDGRKHYSRLSDPGLDALVEEQAREFDYEKRLELCFQIQKMLLNDIIPSYWVLQRDRSHRVLAPSEERPAVELVGPRSLVGRHVAGPRGPRVRGRRGLGLPGSSPADKVAPPEGHLLHQAVRWQNPIRIWGIGGASSPRRS